MSKIFECFDNVGPNQIQEQKMLNNIIKQGGNTMKKTSRKRIAGRLIAAVVAVAVLVVGGVVAVNHFFSERDVAQQLLQGNEIVVNGVIVDAPLPFIVGADADDETFMEALSQQGLAMVMVPMEPIAAELGIEVTAATPAEAVEKDGYTFVPLTFFRDELGVLQVYSFEGQIVIENRADYVMM